MTRRDALPAGAQRSHSSRVLQEEVHAKDVQVNDLSRKLVLCETDLERAEDRAELGKRGVRGPEEASLSHGGPVFVSSRGEGQGTRG